jgi:D-glycero-D-manno-heptose 1,7-bisphosphate phosphatase
VAPAVFLDRDNTLIANDGDLGDPDAVMLLDGVAAGLRALREAGYRLVVVTNQGGVARGVFSEADVDAVNQRIVELLRRETGDPLIERFYYCPYHPEGTVAEYRSEHPWRKPAPGMLLQAARDLRLDLPRSWIIGDGARDVQAGQSAGCRTVLIAPAPPEEPGVQPTAVVGSFADATQVILKRSARPPVSGSPAADPVFRPAPPRPPSEGSDAAPFAQQTATAVLETKPLVSAGEPPPPPTGPAEPLSARLRHQQGVSVTPSSRRCAWPRA